MKLEGEMALFHSNTGLEPESESFEFNEDDLNSVGYKQKNQKVKQHDNIDSKKSEQDSDLSLHNKESLDCMTTPKVSDDIIELKNDYEAEVRGFLDPLSNFSNDIESFIKLPNDIESVKKSAKLPVSKSLDKIDSFENSVDVYMDKSVTACEPEMVVCYKDSSYVVKDICVDEGVPKMEFVSFENIVEEKAYGLFPSESYDNKEMKKGSIETNALKPLVTEESDLVCDDHGQSKDLMHEDEAVPEKLNDNVNREMILPEDKISLQELDIQESRPSDNKNEQVSSEPSSQSQFEESKNITEEVVLAYSKNVSQTTGAMTVDESSGDSILFENGTFTYGCGPSTPAACGNEECHQIGICKCDETQTSRILDGVTGGKIVTSQDRHILGESSFSAAGPISGRISYSGPVPYSGSISLRSDSSTTSTRSFAFPILQSEWNSSPVRMAKADKRNYRKHRGWRHNLLCCCRF